MTEFEKAVDATLKAKQLVASLQALNKDSSELLHLHIIPMIAEARMLHDRLNIISSALAPKGE